MSQLFHVQFAVVQRSKGDDARKVSAYQMCARVTRRDGKPYDFRRKKAEHQAHAMMLPAGAPVSAEDPATLWQAAEDAETRGNAQTARLIELSIPREVPADLRMEMARAVVAPWVADGMCAQVDLHCTTATDGHEQPHAHILLTMRRFDGGIFAKTKERDWNTAFRADDGRAMRAQVAARMNAFMERHGIQARLDHRTHAEQGIAGPPPERNAPRRAWAAHRVAPESEGAKPVRQVLANREQRKAARRDLEWEAARAAYATAAAEHYAAEKDRRKATYANRRQAEQAARSEMRTRQRAERDHVYRRMGRGLGRDITLTLQRGWQGRERGALDTQIQADRMSVLPASRTFPGFDEWLDAKAAQGDRIAKAALEQRQARREWLARKDPAAAARRYLADAERAADRVLRGRPRGSFDDQVLFAATRSKLTERRDQAAEAARAARLAVIEHWRGASWWRRWTDAGWRAEHAQLTGMALAARQGANRIAGRYDADVRTARTAARQAAKANRLTLAEWLDRADVRAAQAAKNTSERVRSAVDAGDEATIQAAARADLPAAAQAAEAAHKRRASEEQHRREQQRADQAAARAQAEQRARDIAEATRATRAAAARNAPAAHAAPGYRIR